MRPNQFLRAIIVAFGMTTSLYAAKQVHNGAWTLPSTLLADSAGKPLALPPPVTVCATLECIAPKTSLAPLPTSPSGWCIGFQCIVLLPASPPPRATRTAPIKQASMM